MSPEPEPAVITHWSLFISIMEKSFYIYVFFSLTWLDTQGGGMAYLYTILCYALCPICSHRHSLFSIE
jgi:hypothetical protein